jgi:hypothetical protein
MHVVLKKVAWVPAFQAPGGTFRHCKAESPPLVNTGKGRERGEQRRRRESRRRSRE